jgi:hypothetical protein
MHAVGESKVASPAPALAEGPQPSQFVDDDRSLNLPILSTSRQRFKEL